MQYYGLESDLWALGIMLYQVQPQQGMLAACILLMPA